MNNPSISDLIIATLFSARSPKRFRSILAQRNFKRINYQSVNVTLARLSKKGVAVYSAKGWALSAQGKKRMQAIKFYSYIPSPFENKEVATTLVSFDIPEKERVSRNWLRNQLKIFGYEMIHQSLWFGPGPLPQNFLKRLDGLKLRSKLKIFSKVRRTH